MAVCLNWLAMNGYSYYIWSAYGLVALVMVVNIIEIKHQRNKVWQKLQRWFNSSL